MFAGQRVAVIIPALDEEQVIASVVSRIDRDLVDEVIVVDNGSHDATAQRAAAAGAAVVCEARRGYGSACLTGIARAGAGGADVLVFMDGDGSDDPREIRSLLQVLDARSADMVVGSRVLGASEPGALTPLQRFGNWLTCTLVHLLWGVRYSDLGPLRAIRRAALEPLKMSDPDFGWTVEMQVKAAQRGLRVEEIPVRYHRRQAGRSKVSGTALGSYRAGKRILGYVVRAKLEELRPR